MAAYRQPNVSTDTDSALLEPDPVSDLPDIPGDDELLLDTAFIWDDDEGEKNPTTFLDVSLPDEKLEHIATPDDEEIVALELFAADAAAEAAVAEAAVAEAAEAEAAEAGQGEAVVDGNPDLTEDLLQQVMQEQASLDVEGLSDAREPAPEKQEGPPAVPADEISKINVNILKYILENGPQADTGTPGAGVPETPADAAENLLSENAPGADDEGASLEPGELPPLAPRPTPLPIPSEEADLGALDAFGSLEPEKTETEAPQAVTEEPKPVKPAGERTVVNKNIMPWQKLAEELGLGNGGVELSPGIEEIAPDPDAPATPAPTGLSDGLSASQGGKSKIFRFHPDLAELEKELAETGTHASAPPAPPKAQPKVSTILLAVEKVGSYSRVINYHFKRANWSVQVGEGVNKSLQIASPERISLVIADTTIKGFFELLFELKVNKSTNHIPIIAVSPDNMNPGKHTQLRVLPDEELVEPFEMGSLLRHSDWELARAFRTGVVFDQRVHMVLPTRLDILDEAKKAMSRLLFQSGLDKDQQTSLVAGFYEALGNASRHGNRNRPATSVEVLYLLDREKVSIAVKDEGDGFDTGPYCSKQGVVDREKVLEERLREQDTGSMGIPLLAQCADKVQYNEAGNMVTLTKYLGTGSDAPSSDASTDTDSPVRQADARVPENTSQRWMSKYL